jgi:hypothetical protein
MGYRSKQPITPDDRSVYRARFWHFQSWSIRSAFAGIKRTSFGMLKSGNGPKADVGHADCPLRALLGCLSAKAV